MLINWFEGGRRITRLCMAIAAISGGIAIYLHEPPSVQFYTSTPRDRWHPSLVPTDAPEWAKAPLECAYSETFWDFEIKPGFVRNVSLCFLANDQGKIVYYSGAEEAERLKKVEIALSRAKSSGNLDDVRSLSEEAAQVRSRLSKDRLNEWSGEPYATEVKSYIDKRVAEFELNPNTIAVIDKDLPPIEREAFFQHAIQALTITAYFIGGLWAFSFVLGWIVRGFAGIQRGKDFRSNAQSVSDD